MATDESGKLKEQIKKIDVICEEKNLFTNDKNKEFMLKENELEAVLSRVQPYLDNIILQLKHVSDLIKIKNRKLNF